MSDMKSGAVKMTGPVMTVHPRDPNYLRGMTLRVMVLTRPDGSELHLTVNDDQELFDLVRAVVADNRQR